MPAVIALKSESDVPDGIELHETNIKLKSGSTNQIGLLINNHTKHQVIIPAKTKLGYYLETFKLVIEILN